MTKKDYEIKIAAAKANKALNDKQRAQIVAMYEKKIAELEPAKKAEPKAAAKKASKIGSYADYEGEVFEEMEEQGELTRSDAQGIAEQYESFIESQHQAGISAKKTASEILKKSSAPAPKKSEPSDKEVMDYLKKEYSSYAYPKTEKFDDEEYNNAFNEVIDNLREHFYFEDELSANHYAEKFMDAPAKKTEPKTDSKKIDYDCDELIAKAKKAKAAAKKRAAGPQKTEVTKSKENIERVHDKVQKNVEAGKFGKAQLQKLITETEELLTFLKKTLKSL